MAYLKQPSLMFNGPTPVNMAPAMAGCGPCGLFGTSGFGGIFGDDELLHDSTGAVQPIPSDASAVIATTAALNAQALAARAQEPTLFGLPRNLVFVGGVALAIGLYAMTTRKG